MAKSLNIKTTKPSAMLQSDRLRLEVDSVLQSDRPRVWGSDRKTIGYGHGAYGSGPYGGGSGPGYGNGPYGRGPYGVGIGSVQFGTRQEFVAGDYQVRIQAEDALGNLGAWSAAATLQHRPAPPPPINLAIATQTSQVTWSWSDPQIG